MLPAVAALLVAVAQPDITPPPADAPGWRIHASDYSCTAATRFPGGAVLHLGYSADRNESYFQLWDPAWPRLRDAGFLDLVLRFGPGDELGMRGTAIPVADNDPRLSIVTIPVTGLERLQRQRARAFEFVVDGRVFGSYRPGPAIEPFFNCIAAKRRGR